MPRARRAGGASGDDGSTVLGRMLGDGVFFDVVHRARGTPTRRRSSCTIFLANSFRRRAPSDRGESVESESTEAAAAESQVLCGGSAATTDDRDPQIGIIGERHEGGSRAVDGAAEGDAVVVGTLRLGGRGESQASAVVDEPLTRGRTAFAQRKAIASSSATFVGVSPPSSPVVSRVRPDEFVGAGGHDARAASTIRFSGAPTTPSASSPCARE